MSVCVCVCVVCVSVDEGWQKCVCGEGRGGCECVERATCTVSVCVCVSTLDVVIDSLRRLQKSPHPTHYLICYNVSYTLRTQLVPNLTYNVHL